MRITNLGEVALDGQDSERLSKLIEWADSSQFVISIDHVTVQDANQFIQDWKAVQKTHDWSGLSITNYKVDPVLNDNPTIKNEAERCARLARTLLSWNDARAALILAVKLLNEWEKTQSDDAK